METRHGSEDTPALFPRSRLPGGVRSTWPWESALFCVLATRAEIRHKAWGQSGALYRGCRLSSPSGRPSAFQRPHVWDICGSLRLERCLAVAPVERQRTSDCPDGLVPFAAPSKDVRDEHPATPYGIRVCVDNVQFRPSRCGGRIRWARSGPNQCPQNLCTACG